MRRFPRGFPAGDSDDMKFLPGPAEKRARNFRKSGAGICYFDLCHSLAEGRAGSANDGYCAARYRKFDFSVTVRTLSLESDIDVPGHNAARFVANASNLN